MVLESKFQSELIRRIKSEFPGAVIIRTDPSYIQGIPDWLVLNGPCWAGLEIKASRTSPLQPNQRYWIKKLNRMSFAKFVFPENEKEFLDELQYTFRHSG